MVKKKSHPRPGRGRVPARRAETGLKRKKKTNNKLVQSHANEGGATPKDVTPAQPAPSIIKPDKPGFLSRFKSRRPPTMAGVITPLNPLKVMRISEARDFVRLHPDEAHGWTDELCFVLVPVKDDKKPALLHLIDEDLAVKYLQPAEVKRHRIALATKATGALFLCSVPSQNLDNGYNKTSSEFCEEAKTKWLKVYSRKSQGYDDYQREIAPEQDAFTAEWGPHSVETWCEVTFREASIMDPDHPGLLRLLGRKQKLS